jgi:hypothetical protein
MSTGEEWRRRVRRVRADRAAAKRRHPASGRAQDRPGMIRALPAQSDRQLPDPTSPTNEETNLTALPACRCGCPVGECSCEETDG